MREWKPGDVAAVTAPNGSEHRAVMGRRDWVCLGSGCEGDSCAVRDARLLVVIDPEDREQVALLLSHYHSWKWDGAKSSAAIADMQTALREFANPTPPRILEPGTWGVVEAACCHSNERRNWIHHPDSNWWPAENYGAAATRSNKGLDPRLPDGWDDLIDPTLVREGVTP